MTAKRIIMTGVVFASLFLVAGAAVEIQCLITMDGPAGDWCPPPYSVAIGSVGAAFITMQICMFSASWIDRKQSGLTSAMLMAAGEFDGIRGMEPQLRTTGDCRRYAVRFLFAASALVSLGRNAEDWPKVDAAKFIFAESEIDAVGSIMEWFDSKQLNIRYGTSAFRLWPNLAGHSREYEDRQTAGHDTLPEALRNYDSLPDD